MQRRDGEEEKRRERNGFGAETEGERRRERGGEKGKDREQEMDKAEKRCAERKGNQMF
jgi:hypothetical protein